MGTVQNSFIFHQNTDERGRGEENALEKVDAWFSNQPATTRILAMVGNERKVLVVYEEPKREPRQIRPQVNAGKALAVEPAAPID